MSVGKYLPIIGHIIDLGVFVAGRVKDRRALRAAVKDAEKRQRLEQEARLRLDRILTDAKKLK